MGTEHQQLGALISLTQDSGSQTFVTDLTEEAIEARVRFAEYLGGFMPEDLRPQYEGALTQAQLNEVHVIRHKAHSILASDQARALIAKVVEALHQGKPVIG